MTVERGLNSVETRPVLPRRLAEILRPELPTLGGQIVEEIRTVIPEYGRPLDGPYGRSIRAGVDCAMSLFVDQIADPGSIKEELLDVHRKLGQLEMREGRSLDTLQAAYRVGARVAWRRIMLVGRRAGLSSAVMSELADAMFAFMDELASIALDGYLEAKACSAGALETWRRRLLQLILERPQPPREAIAELAQLTGWMLPAKLFAVAVRTPGGVSRRMPSLDEDVLAELDAPEPLLLVPGEPVDARLSAIQNALPGYRLSAGPAVPLEAAADSLRWARRALALTGEGLLPARRLIRAEEHLATVLLHSDEGLIAQLRERHFAPLRGMTDKQRGRLTETLRAWLDAQGNVLEIAERLKVHPQTVRYRMRQLQATFGASLDDPDARFEMELILRSEPRPGLPRDTRETGDGPNGSWARYRLAEVMPVPRTAQNAPATPPPGTPRTRRSPA
ncbi:CdaR family transcriptional regulator [Amycolatopsis sp. YIM 10]|uniref:PucR family transcriptional regulator n=1 Tax=Amycolatopsis sp. YIM 10 TaxID=2653857 RepID=UPI00129001E3|nr:helix-turn-helix domain-containing protein [Amycolatopsis sp. YIM 10]QFU93093.1 hypothetical protein YIM_39770 [Amycolatopsis sp. YIM 10]